MMNYDFGEFVIDQADALGGGSQSLGLRLREQRRPQSKAFFAAQPGVGKNASGVEHSSKIAIVEIGHNLSHCWRLKEEFNSFAEIIKSFFDCISLTGYIKFQTLRDEHIILAPNICSEIQFLDHILTILWAFRKR